MAVLLVMTVIQEDLLTARNVLTVITLLGEGGGREGGREGGVGGRDGGRGGREIRQMKLEG